MKTLLAQTAAAIVISYSVWQESGLYTGFAILVIFICIFILEFRIVWNKVTILALIKKQQNGKLHEYISESKTD